MFIRRITLSVLVLLAVGTVSAAVTPIGEFTGDMGEGFENIYSPGAHPGPIPLFNGFASLDDTLAHTVVITYVWQAGETIVYPYNGNLFSGAVAGSEMFTFSSPITDFGGFFTTIAPIPDGNIKFYGAAGNLLETLPMTIATGDWGWQGWHSSIPLGSIEIIGNNGPGLSVQLDDLQITIPEPGSLALLSLGVVALIRRRG
jgi:hypothetical protein